MKFVCTLALMFYSCSAATPPNAQVTSRPAALLSWQAPAGVQPYDHYNLYKADGSAAFIVLAPDLNRLSFTDYNVKNKHTYRYQVTTIDTVSHLESPPSNVAIAQF